MSLQVWLPLTKDLRQQGIDSSIITGNNVTINASGKLGQCYSFNGTNSYLISSSSPFSNNTDDWSFACWLKPNTSHNACLFCCRTGVNNTGISIFYYSNQIIFDDGTRWQFTPSTSISVNNWNHLVFIRKKGVGKFLYLNGVLINSTTTTGTQSTVGSKYTIGASQDSVNSVNANYLNGYLNDVRVYNHALSQMEVKQLSQGLVLHYSLNRQGWGQENLLLNSANINVNKLNNALDSRTEYWAANFGQSYSNFVGGEQVVLSFDCEMIIRTVPVYFLVYNTNNKGPIQFPNTNAAPQINGLNPSIGDTIKLRIKLPVTMIKRDNPSTTNNFIEFYTNYGSNNFYKITNLKLEEGSIATPWCPNSSDTLATTMGLNSTTEYDCSGFCNNGTRTGTFTWTSDTPKYSVSTVFPSSGTNYINIGTQLYNMRDEMTVSIWVKANDWTSTSKGVPFSSVESGGFGWQASSANYVFYCGTGASSNTYISSTVTVNNLSAGWHMLSATYDGLALRIYIDGVLKNTATKYTTKTPLYYNNNSGMFVSGESAGSLTAPSGSIFRGNLSDLRIYATALSADDVKSLYQNCATIDPDGTIRGQIRS